MRSFRLLLSLLLVAGFAIGFAAFSVGVALVSENATDLPNHDALAEYRPSTGSIILASDGSLLARHADQRRTYVPYDDIPDAVVQAFVSAEDRNYWTHNGVDAIAIARATATNVLNGTMIGGSTITQQVAKNLIVGDEDSLTRKIKEALLAMRMDEEIGKERILEIYLNEFYLGAGAYGVAAAAEAYFSKTLNQLTIEEVALIAGMPKAPSAYDPRNNPERAKERRDYVLRRMAEDGAITAEVAAAAIARPIALRLNMDRDSDVEVRGGWFATDAWESVKPIIEADESMSGDVIVRTTLVPAVQAAANAAMIEGIIAEDQRLGWRGPLGTTTLPVDWSAPELQPPAGSEAFVLGVVLEVADAARLSTRIGELQIDSKGVEWTGQGLAEILSPGDVVLVDDSGEHPVLAQMPDVEGAMVVLDPRNGDVLALVGGFSHQRSVFDRATQAKRQPGSAFKTLVYLTALELGYDATSPLLDATITLEQGPGLEDWRPSDAKGAGQGGLITLRRALELSRNIASVRLLWDLGLEDVSDLIGRLGIDFGQNVNYAIALGSGEVTPMQMALAYGAMANGGHVLTPRFVSSFEDDAGENMRSMPSGLGAVVVDPIATAQIGTILRGVVTDGTAKSAFDGFEGFFAGKTGTTNGSRDAWFVGFAGDVVVAVWIGRDDNRPLADGASGGRTAAAIARDFLDRARGSFELILPAVPETGVEVMTVDPATGMQATEGRNELVREGWYAISPQGSSPEVIIEDDSYTMPLPPSPGYETIQ